MTYPGKSGSCVVLLLWCVAAQAQPDVGFESDSIGQAPAGWMVEAADAVVVVGPEGPAEFPIYGELGVTVSPNLGAQTLRMATPKLTNESQNRGSNSITQTFAAAGGELKLALWTFSLDHRGDDALRVDLQDPSTGASFPVSSAAGDPFVLDMPTGPDPSCAATPCELLLDVGKRQNVLDTGWQIMTISGLPDDGRPLTLVVELEAGQNEALASWVYVDSANTAPAAVMRFNPGSRPGTVAQEADYLVFDCLGSSDAEGDPLTCSWSVEGPGVPATTVVGQTAIFAFTDQGTATVTLTVSDGESNASTTTGDGESPELTIVNGDPLVNALSVEVLPGADVELLCRFVDPGPNDYHDVSLSVGGSLPVDVIEREFEPALSSGFAKTRFTATDLDPGTYDGECVVTDQDGGYGSDAFVVTVLDPQTLADRNLANPGSTLSAPVQRADTSFLGALTTPESIAVYELRQPDGQPFTVGSEVNVTAQVPVDYDIALLNGTTEATTSVAPWVSAPWVSAPWLSAPWVSVPFVSVPFLSVPFLSAPFVSVPFLSAPWLSAPWLSAPWLSAPIETSPWVSADYAFGDFPLSQIGLAAPDGSNISGIDVAFDDLGALSTGSLVNEPVRVKSLSAEFGTNPEQLLVKIGPGEAGLFLAVIPQSGSFTTAPFSVQVEASVPPPQAEVLGATCVGTPLVSSGTTAPEVLVANGQPKSLVITQKQRIMATFGMSEADFLLWLDELLPYFNHPEVMAKVVSVPSTWYDHADSNPCVVEKQNDVARQIRTLIQNELASASAGEPIEYVQLMGSLDIVPAYFVPDESQTGYEGLYLQDLWVRPGTPLSVAIGEGNNITDAFYGDAEPLPFRGRSLYIEDISVSRLVERPEEIAENARRFVVADGVINLTSTQSTGYDFFIDGTEQINEILAGLPVPSTTRNDDTWTAADLRCQFFGRGEGCVLSELNAVNAHFSYNGAVSADGFFNGTPGEVIASTESADVLNGVTFSIGCHSGLSVPDAWALAADVGLPLDPARDWVQELGTWVGSYNFAYGDSVVADRGTEGIMPLVIENFIAGETLGNALTKAKWRYGTGLYEFGVYDEKSLIALGLFGMPQATLAVPGVAPEPSGNAIGETTASASSLQLDVEERGAVTTYAVRLEEQTNADVDGTWYTADGNAQAIFGRPLQPVVKPFEVREMADGESIHGVVLRGGLFTEYLERDPVFPVQTHDWIGMISEPNPCVETMAPTQIASVTRFDSPAATLQSLIVQPGQFECTLAPTDQGEEPVSGTFRIWDDIDIELMLPLQASQDVDFEPPVVVQQDLLADPASMSVTAVLDATDNLGMREIIALVYEDLDGVPGGPGEVVEFSTGDITGIPGPHTLVLPGAFDKRLSFQYVDVAGNVLAKTLKGSLLQPVEVAIVTSFFSSGATTTVVVEVVNFTALSSPYLRLDFGDGSEVLVMELTLLDGSPVAGVEVANDGTATISIEHDFSAAGTGSVTARAEIRAASALGYDEAVLSACGDPVGDALLADGDITGCSIEADGTTLSVDVLVAGSISDDLQYRLRLTDTNTQIKYAAGEVTAPNKLKASATVVDVNRLRFTFNGTKAGWGGAGVFGFGLSTQDGVAGGQSAGIVDTTQEFEFDL